MAAWLSQRSTILSTFSASAINYSTLSGSAITLNSTMISLGTSTNSVYTRLSQGNFNSSVSTSSWVSSLTNRVSTTTVAMSANAQYQLALSQSSISTSVMFTSTLGSSWSTLSGATGLPNYSTISYTAGAVSGTGQYGVLGTSAGQLLVTSTFGQTFSGHANTTSPTPRIYLPFENSITDSQGNSNVTTLVTPVYVPGIIGNNAINIANTTTGTTAIATQYVRGTWANNLSLTSYTVSFWFNQQTNSGQQYIFSAFNGVLSVQINSNGHIYASIPSATAPFFNTFTIPVLQTIILNTWYNITLIYQSTDVCYLYLNNTLYGTIVGAGIYSGGNSGLFSLGSVDNYSGYTFNGYIDDFKIYNSAILPYTNVVSSPTPFIYLPFDGSTADSQGNAIIAPTGSPNYVSGILGTNAIYLNNASPGTGTAATQYVRGTSWQITSDFTISFWANPQSVSPSMILFSAASGAIIVQTDASSRLQLNAPGISINTQYVITANTWYYIMVIFRANGICTFSVNNVLVAQVPSTGTITGTTFGLGTYDINSQSNAFFGYIEDFKIYRSAIPFVNMTSSVAPTIYLPLDTVPVSGTTGGTTLTVPIAPNNPTSASSFVIGSGAVRLANSTTGGNATQYIHGTWTVPTSFSVNLWFNVQSTSTNQQYIFSTGTSTWANTTLLYLPVDNTTLILQTPGNVPIGTPYRIALNTWYNVFFTIQSNGTCFFYVNNVLIGTVTSTNTTLSTGNFGLGTFDAGGPSLLNGFSGFLDDVKIYNTALPNALLYPTFISTPLIYLPLNTVPTNGSVTLGASPVPLTVVGTPTQAPSYIMGTGAINLTNPIGGYATQSIRIPWSIGTSFTWTFWFNTAGSGLQQDIITATFGGVSVVLTSDNYLFAYSNKNLAQTTFKIVPNTWYSVVFIYQLNSTGYFYVNNQLIGTFICPSYGNSSETVTIGSNNTNLGDAAFSGYIDDFKIYNTAVPFTPMYPPQSFTSTAVSNTGQYMLATMANQGLYMSSNFGGTFSPVTGAMLSAIWSNAQVSATGQYMLVNAQPQIVQPQLTGLTTASWQTNGITWNASASSTLPPGTAPYYTYYAFNNAPGGTTWASADLKYNTSGGAYIGSTSTVVNGQGTVAGEWLQIQSSASIQMQSYTFHANAAVQYMNGFTIAGSNDGVNWYLLQSVVMSGNPCGVTDLASSASYINVNQSGPQTMTTTGGSATFTCTISSYSVNSYTYFRLICPASFGAGLIAITQWYIRFQAGGQTYSTNYGATWSNQPTLYSQQMLMPSPTISPQRTGLTGDTTTATVVPTTWTQNGVSWTSNASTIFQAGFQPWVAFNNVGNASGSVYAWASALNYASGIYNTSGKTPTPISSPGSGDYYGEWLQIYSSVPLIMYSYNFASGGNTLNIPKAYFIVGSTNNSTWFPIQSVTLSSNPFTTGSTIATSPAIIVNSSASQTINGGAAVSFTPTIYSTTANAYNYFRIIANTNFGTSGNTAFELNEWYVNFLNPNSIAASIISPSTTLALSESGQYALSAMVSNPVLLGELNFELSSPNQYDDSIAGGLTNPTAQGTGITISSTAKVGTKSLSIVNTAGQSGSNSYVSYTLPSFFAGFPNAFTISAWIRPSSLPLANTGAVPIHMGFVGLDGGKTLLQMVIYPSGIFSFEFFTTTNLSTQLQIITVSAITLNVWTHVTGVIANGMAYVYINGVLQNSASYTGVPCIQTIGLAATTLVVGCVAGNYNQYAGLIDNVRIYNSALTPQQIQTIYANNVSSTDLIQISPSFSVSPQQTGLTSNSWTQNGVSWTASQSATYNGSTLAYNAFSGAYAIAWAGAPNAYKNGSPFDYTAGTYSTNIQGVGSTGGDWLQIQSSVPLIMASYTFASSGILQQPQKYYIVGSNDGQIWFPIQLANGTVNPLTTANTACSSYLLVSTSTTPTAQTIQGNTTGSYTTTGYASSLNTYTYFRIVVTNTWGYTNGNTNIGQWFINFTGGTNTSLYNIVSPLTGLSTNTYTSGTIPGVITNSAISNTGQYMVVITNNVSGNNVYYSMNYGATFTGLQLGTQVLTSCAMSYDGSYITIASGATVYTLNNNSTGFSVALGNQAGYQNQANNAIAIGNYAGYQNQTANSIILNASGPGALGTGLNAVVQGFYVAPIASCVASSSQSFSILGYGSDNQVVQTGLTVLPDTGTFNLNAPVGSTTSGILSSRYYLWGVGDNQDADGINNNVYGPWYGVGMSGIPGFTNVPCLCGFYGVSMRSGSGYIILTEAGRVGIGTTNPTAALQVNGSLAKSSGTFDIAHPLHPTTKRLVHSFIEGPRCDLIYRGTVALTNGIATVDINRQCTHNTVGAMEHGTFEALCANPDVFLQNRTGFGRVIGTIQGAILTITCENNTATDLISWMVVAERADPFIKQWDRTDNDGYLITEYSQ